MADDLWGYILLMILVWAFVVKVFKEFIEHDGK